MNNYMPLLISLGMALALTPFIIKLARKFGIYDKPNEDRKIHNGSIPLLGGLAIYIAFISTLLFFIEIQSQTIAFLVVSTVIVIMGITDDLYDVPARIKFLIQMACAIYISIFGYRLDIGQYLLSRDALVVLFDISLTTLWLIGIINAINLIDGLDGLAGGVAAIGSIGFIIVGYLDNNLTITTIAFALLGGICGFLFYNKYPAKIFMGDAGSLLLGYTLGVLSIMNVDVEHNMSSLLTPIFFLVIPIFDTGWAILRRLLSKKDIFGADRGHIHHRLLDMGNSQRKTVLIIYAIAAIFVTIGTVIHMGKYFTVGLFIIGFIIILGIYLSIYTVRKEQSIERREFLISDKKGHAMR